MGRDLRGEELGGIYHVYSRGNNKEWIVQDDLDRTDWLDRLDVTTLKYRWVVYAYCLMTNHFHLVVGIPYGGLSVGMQSHNGGYSRRTNRRYGRVGHLVQNRFSAEPVTSDEQLLEEIRYTVLNPVRAGIVDDPEDWPWSSYRACAGLSPARSCLALDDVLRLFGQNPDTARAAFRSFVAAGYDPRENAA